ncbi:hypothetical protein [Streptomyces griseorubiginosus]|uniref:hypothetical protein n=1 Tax=Streptomyces griseorubiginosus TaxID=67304 RepID=UPI003669178C
MRAASTKRGNPEGWSPPVQKRPVRSPGLISFAGRPELVDGCDHLRLTAYPLAGIECLIGTAATLGRRAQWTMLRWTGALSRRSSVVGVPVVVEWAAEEGGPVGRELREQ